MSCVLRVTAPDIHNRLSTFRVKAFRINENTAHFIASSLDDFEGQVDETLSFLVTNKTEIVALLEGEDTEGCLDFAVEVEVGFIFRRFAAPLVKEAAALNLMLEMSIYVSAHEGR